MNQTKAFMCLRSSAFPKGIGLKEAPHFCGASECERSSSQPLVGGAMDCGGKRSATPLWIKRRDSAAIPFPRRIQSGVAVALCHRTPHPCAPWTAVGSEAPHRFGSDGGSVSPSPLAKNPKRCRRCTLPPHSRPWHLMPCEPQRIPRGSSRESRNFMAASVRE
jgi:hypothetical protein